VKAHGRFIEHMSEYLNTSNPSSQVTERGSSVRHDGVQSRLQPLSGGNECNFASGLVLATHESIVLGMIDQINEDNVAVPDCIEESVKV
jgi:hypothetical protein